MISPHMIFESKTEGAPFGRAFLQEIAFSHSLNPE
jgi:hypothetical protein